MRLREHTRVRDGDEGFTLVELIVYIVLLVLLLGMAAMLFINTLEVQRDVRAVAVANNSAQLTFSQLERDLRNAQWVDVNDGGALVTMLTRTGDETLSDGTEQGLGRCVGYYLDPASSLLKRTNTRDGGTAIDAAANAASASALATATVGWTSEPTSFSAPSGETPFGTDGSYSVGDIISIHLEAETIAGRNPVTFEKSITLRPQGGLGDCGP